MPYLSSGGEELRADCVMLDCSAIVACLPYAISPPLVIWFDRFHLVPVAISCGLLPRMCRRMGRAVPCGVASTASPFERFNRF